MKEVEDFLTVSEKLYSHLTNLPAEENRIAYIEEINQLLDVRETAIRSIGDEDLSVSSFYDRLVVLDKGINQRLEKFMASIKGDIKDLQQKKRHESAYSNPYAATQTLDGMYFDNKK
ncbi:flagellar protein FliT [Psychrobacillus sp. NPDC096623]|uniref:flagellar protein FliT n=1 Tax=Psychrobacillus sp. NPDC096623 TaxID=3364492 RepID=UPI00382BD748